MKPSIALKDLVVVSMPNPTEIDAPVKPWQGMEKLFIAEDCNRFTFVLTKDEAAKLPAVIASLTKDDKAHPPAKRYPVKMETGRTAYATMLKLALGMEDVISAKPGDQKYVIPQWEAFSAKNPDRIEDFGGIIDDVRRDMHFVNTHTKVAQLPKPTPAFAVRNLLGLAGDHKPGTPKKHVLVITDTMGEAHDVLRTLGQSAAVGSITLAAPDASHGNAAFTEFQREAKEGRLSIKTPLELVTFDKAMQNMDQFDHTVICMDSGKFPKADTSIRDAWKAKGKKDGMLAHYAATFQKVEAISPWIESELKNFITPGRIAGECARQITENEQVLGQAEAMVNDRAVARHMLHMTRSGNGQGHERG